MSSHFTAVGGSVLAPTLSGLAERHNLIPWADLDTHVTDLVELVECHDRNDVVVYVHSYCGIPATGAVDRLGDRAAPVVNLDALVPTDGQRGADVSGNPTPEGW